MKNKVLDKIIEQLMFDFEVLKITLGLEENFKFSIELYDYEWLINVPGQSLCYYVDGQEYLFLYHRIIKTDTNVLAVFKNEIFILQTSKEITE